MPVTTEQGPAKSESRAGLLKAQVERIDGILSTLATWNDIPGLEVTRERLQEIKEKAVEALRSTATQHSGK